MFDNGAKKGCNRGIDNPICVFMLTFLKKFFLNKASFLMAILSFIFLATPINARAQENSGAPAVVVIQTLPGTTIFQEFNGQRMRVGSVPEDGLLILDNTLYAGTYRFVFENDDAAEPAVLEDVVLKAGSAKKLAPTFKMKKGELVVTCLPTETEIFVNGKHASRGSLVSGEYDIGSELTIEARSSVYGIETKRVKLEKGKTARVSFDLRGRIPANIPDGKIVLSDVALVLAKQPAAIIKVDGAAVELKNECELLNLQPGVRRVEIAFPLNETLLPVWRGAFKAVPAIMEGADKPSALLDWNALEANRAAAANVGEKPAVPAVVEPATAPKTVVPAGKVEMTLAGNRVILSMTEGARELVPAAAYFVKRAGKNDVPVKISTVAGTTATATVMKTPAEADALVEGESFSLEIAGLAADIPEQPKTKSAEK